MSVAPNAGEVQWLDDDLRCVLAPNPSPMTYWGTNSYIVGRGTVAVIDPGPDILEHLDALLRALEPGEQVSHILVTHTHLDHSPGAAPLSQETGAPVLAFGGATAGRSERMEALAALGTLEGGEGMDLGFSPDITLADGDWIEGDGWKLQALWTPGHIGNHLCFYWPMRDALFSADLVMGWTTSLVSPPDGDLSAFLSSLNRLDALEGVARYYPGHGNLIEDPAARVAELRNHRLMRTDQIVDELAKTPGTSHALATRIYTDVPEELLPAAARNVLAHLIDLEGRGEVAFEGEISPAAVARLSG